jgi:SAM-dependent methyltransferase
MQTPAEKYMVQKIVSLLKSGDIESKAARILNIGAGQSLSIERQLSQFGCRYISDRADVENCMVGFSSIGDCWHCAVEDMKPVSSGRYKLAFANYVLEHVNNLDKAAMEIYRVLQPGGVFLATVPNILAPEFILAKYTPLWFHKLLRQGHGWETIYPYNDIDHLANSFVQVGLWLTDLKYWPFTYGYLYKYPILDSLGKMYDNFVSKCNIIQFMGQVCIVLEKGS